MHDRYRVSIEVLENGFVVEIPDFDEMAKKQAAAKKAKQPEPYMGDCTKKFSARNVKEVMKIVGQSLENMPDAEYNAAFDEAAAKK